MNSSKAKVSFLVVSTLLLIIYATGSMWFFNYVEKLNTLNEPVEQRISMTEKVLEKLESEEQINKLGVIKILESGMEFEKANEEYLSSIENSLKYFSLILFGVLLIHISSIGLIVEHLCKKKT